MTQTEKIKRHLELYGAITPLDALNEYGIMRLASRISDLKRSGVEIEKRMIKNKNRYGEDVYFAEYRIGGNNA